MDDSYDCEFGYCEQDCCNDWDDDDDLGVFGDYGHNSAEPDPVRMIEEEPYTFVVPPSEALYVAVYSYGGLEYVYSMLTKETLAERLMSLLDDGVTEIKVTKVGR